MYSIPTIVLYYLILGMVHKIKGEVIHGNGIGRKINFPTANVAIADDLPVRDGVYVAEVNLDNRILPAMVNIGKRPTVEEAGGRFAEAHIFGFSEDIYGAQVILFLLESIRPEQKFDNLAELKRQLEKDKEHALAYFNFHRI